MDLGLTEADLLVGPQLQLRHPPGPPPDQINPQSSADTRTDGYKLRVAQPRGRILANPQEGIIVILNTGARSKVSTTPAAWRNDAPDPIPQTLEQEPRTIVNITGVARMRGLDD